MDKELIKAMTFEVSEDNRLGTMRIDWGDGAIANQWYPTKLLAALETSHKIDKRKLQQELNYLQFDLLSSFDSIEKYCNGTGYGKEQLFSFLGTYNYAIRLIPSMYAYSYIYVYLK